MFAKIFAQIFDSSIAEDWQTRVVFQDMLILADKDGVVDMTPTSIARRTNVPLETVLAAIPKLEAPDHSSRTPDQDGRRIARLDAHRDWGWQIVNYAKYRESASKEMLRMAESDRKKTYRAKFGKSFSPTPPIPKTEIEKQRENSPGHVTNCPGHVPDNSAGNPPDSKFSKQETISSEKELQRVIKELAGRKPADASGPNTRKRIETLIARQTELRAKLGVVA